jgi:hypothetical protein
MTCLRLRLRLVLLIFIFPSFLLAQTQWKDIPPDSLKDLTDVVHQVFRKDTKKEQKSREKNHLQIGVFPAIGYTLQTGFAVVVSANVVVYKKNRLAKDSSLLPSTFSTSLSYSQKNQIILPLQATFYFNNNNTILISDWRYLKYPTYTYGLGMNTTPQDTTFLNYQYGKFHQAILFKLAPHFFAGAGFDLDYFWNVKQVYKNPAHETDFEKYGYTSSSVSSGVSLHLLRDTRDNPIYPHKGTYANIQVIPRFQFLGSDANWTSMVLDWRGYFRFPKNSANILAFWSYDWVTLSGHPPYLMLPSTAWDRTFNTGRGYIQGRFRSTNMLDAEAEYRIQLTRNGLFGMVIFGNLESFSNVNTWEFESAAPGGGIGLRLKLNKYSRTNISIDYGWGRQGSHGFFVNLGEAF